ncbi:unnamed protein product [Adineta ricciae]|uniref:Uncharacterized protein n=1 Tax=Adineta ricciae TaxID=249248 RepID=A0A814UBH9_ADIRI|nr:unnamed protein product [Adineta ricciae]
MYGVRVILRLMTITCDGFNNDLKNTLKKEQSRRMLFSVIVLIQSVWGLLIDKKRLWYFTVLQVTSGVLALFLFLSATYLTQVNVIDPIPIENEQELEEANWEHSPSIES